MHDTIIAVTTTRKISVVVVLSSAIFLATKYCQHVKINGIRFLQMDNARAHIIDNAEVSIGDVMVRHPTVQIILQPPISPAMCALNQQITWS